MSKLYPVCRGCVCEDTHKPDDFPCNVCHQGDASTPNYVVGLRARVTTLEAQVAKMRKALEEIAKVPKRFQTSDTLYGFIELLFSKINSNRDLAREALKDLPPT